MKVAVRYYRSHDSEGMVVNDNFELIDKVEDCKKLFDKLEESLSASWDIMYEKAKAYYEKNGCRIPVMGLPGCVMYSKRTVFDLILPRVLAGDLIDDIGCYGQGGLCLNCEICTFPNCGFGK